MRALNSRPPDKLDELLKVIAAGRKVTVPVTRLVYFGHLTVTQGIAARRYADIVRNFARYRARPDLPTWSPPAVERISSSNAIIRPGASRTTLADARRAKREYQNAMKVLGRFATP